MVTGHHLCLQWFSCRLKYSLDFQRLAKNIWWDSSHLTEGEGGLGSPMLAAYLQGPSWSSAVSFLLMEDDKADEGRACSFGDTSTPSDTSAGLAGCQAWRVRVPPAILRAAKRQSSSPDSGGWISSLPCFFTSKSCLRSWDKRRGMRSPHRRAPELWFPELL